MSTSSTSTSPSDQGSPADRGASPGGGKASRLSALLVFIVSLVVFSNTSRHELVYDDSFLINPSSNRTMAPVSEDLSAAFALFGKQYWEGVGVEGDAALAVRGQALYRPLTLFIWAVVNHYHMTPESEQEAAKLPVKDRGGFAGSPYHLINILLNALTATVFYFVLVRLFGKPVLALIAALIFTAHPLHSEAVAYVAGLSDILTGLTVFLGLLFWLKATEVPGRLRTGSFLALIITLFVGLFAKESAVLLIAVVALADFVRSRGEHTTTTKHRLLIYGSLIIVLIGFLSIRYSVVGAWVPQTESIGRLDNMLASVDTDVRVINSVKLVSKYFWLSLWPQNLSIDYSFQQIPLSASFSEPAPLTGLLLILTMLIVGLAKARRAPAIGFGLLMFLGTTIFFSNMLVPIGTIFAERLTYLPSAGLAIAAAALLVQLFGRGGRTLASLQPIGLLIALAVVSTLSIRTWERNEDFRSTTTLFNSALKVSPNSSRVHCTVGTLLSNEKLYDDAMKHFRRAVQLDSQFIQAAIHLAQTLSRTEQYEQAERAYQSILESIGPVNRDGTSNSSVRAELFRSLAESRRAAGDFEGAQEALNRSRDLSGEPDGNASRELLALLLGQERWSESLAIIEDALAVSPDDAQFLMAKARAAIGLEDVPTYESALASLEQTERGAVVAKVMRLETQYKRAEFERDMDGLEETTAAFEQISRDWPDMASPYVFLGRYLLDVTRDPEAAIVEFDKALDRDPLASAALESKAIALMDLGRYEDAKAVLTTLGGVHRDVTFWWLWSDVHFYLGDLDQQQYAEDALEALGESVVELIINKALAANRDGRVEDALEMLDKLLVVPGNESNVRLLVVKGELLLNQLRFDEALAALDAADASFSRQPDIVYDEYLPIRRALCLVALGRHIEAAGELERVEQRMTQLEWEDAPKAMLRSALLQRRAQLFGNPDGPLHNLAEVERICLEGIELTEGRFPPFYDISIEAFAQQGDLDSAIARAVEGAASMRARGLPHEKVYDLTASILEKAKLGDLKGMRELIEGSAYPLHRQLLNLLGD